MLIGFALFVVRMVFNFKWEFPNGPQTPRRVDESCLRIIRGAIVNRTKYC